MVIAISSLPDITVASIGNQRHYYSNGGYVGRSVTTIQSIALDDGNRPAHVPEDTWNRAGERGRAIHEAIRMLEGGYPGMTLDRDSLHHEVLPRIEAYEAFKSDEGWQPSLIECPVVHDDLGYGGTMDAFGMLRDSLTFTDWKGGVELGRHGAQIAAYEKAAIRMGLVPAGKYERACVYLHDDGTYTIRAYAGAEDWYDFLAAMRIAAAKERYHGNY